MKTKPLNLENYGVQKMSEKEVKETQGGWVWIVLAIAASLLLISDERQ